MANEVIAGRAAQIELKNQLLINNLQTKEITNLKTASSEGEAAYETCKLATDTLNMALEHSDVIRNNYKKLYRNSKIESRASEGVLILLIGYLVYHGATD